MEDSEWKMDRRKSGKRESGNNWKTEGFIRELRQVTRIFREDDKFAKFAKLADGFPISAFCFPNWACIFPLFALLPPVQRHRYRLSSLTSVSRLNPPKAKPSPRVLPKS
jgi:hypothetical protein